MNKRKEILLRIAPDLWEEIAHWASDELRSVNGHIEFLLRESVRAKRQGKSSREPKSSEGRKSD